jgi:cobalt-zinc-cadmium efflux system membrane fusion protein
MKILRRPHIYFIASALTVALMAACSSGPGESESKMTSYGSGASKADTADLFHVPPDQMAHLQVVPVEKGNVQRILRLSGSVAFNAFQTTPVFAAVGGPVHEILATPGQVVHQGQPLLTVTSPDYSSSRSAYVKARDSSELADKLYARAKDLYAHGAIAEADLQQAESTQLQAHADLESAADALRALGVTDPEALAKNPPKVTGQVPVVAPVSGEIVERLVGPGQLLQAGGTQCFTISNTDSVWVLVNVYQNDLPYVHTGDVVEINTESYPQTFHGKVSYIAPALDPTTRTLQARIVTPNPARLLKKDMYVTVTLHAGAIKNAFTVPDSAVLRDTENQPFVYVQTGSNEFSRRVVSLGDSENGRTQISSGLKDGDKVVGDGSLFLQFKNSLQH